MQLHELKRNTERRKTRVGRGGKRGKTSGAGHKGQKARGNPRPAIRDVIKKLPKNRGYSFNPIQTKPVVINLNLIDKKFNDGEVVSPAILVSKKILNLKKGSVVKVKILSMGEISKKIIVEGCLVSEKAVEKIKKAGGEIK
ncbi:MAG: uL15 family ribosomal protein [Patescibacteria group bacterium]